MIKKLSTDKNDEKKTFYDSNVEKIVKSKMDKFTYGSEVEIGGMLPSEEVDT